MRILAATQTKRSYNYYILKIIIEIYFSSVNSLILVVSGIRCTAKLKLERGKYTFAKQVPYLLLINN